MKLIFTTLFGFLFFMVTSVAHAADPFTVSGIAVDATGQTPIEAQTLAIRDGQARAANILLERLTVESERLTKGTVPVSEDNAAKMIRAMEIDNEKRSSTRYLGDITVAFNPSAMQAYLRQSGLTMISSQSRDRLVLAFPYAYSRLVGGTSRDICQCGSRFEYSQANRLQLWSSASFDC